MANNEKPLNKKQMARLLKQCRDFSASIKDVESSSRELNLKLSKLKVHPCAVFVVTSDHTLYPKKTGSHKANRNK